MTRPATHLFTFQVVLLAIWCAPTHANARLFDSVRHTDAGGAPIAIAVGDLNGDRIPDLVVAMIGGGLSVRLGHGNGSFTEPIVVHVSASPLDVKLADADLDGHLDALVLANDESLNLLLGAGDGTFGDSLIAPTTVAAYEPILVEHFNQDRYVDVLVASRFDYVGQLLGRPNGSFVQVPGIALDRDVASLAAGDFDGDGHVDVVGLHPHFNDFVPGILSVWFGRADSLFEGPTVTRPAPFPTAITTGDLNRDGRDELMVSAFGQLHVYWGNSGREFTTPISFGQDFFADQLRSADLDRDGLQDVLGACCDQLWFFRGARTALWHPRTFFVGTVGPFAIADFDMDGANDVVWGNRLTQTLSFLWGAGGPDPQIAPSYPNSGDTRSVATGDFDLDGHVDVAAGLLVGDQAIAIYSGLGDGTFAAANHLEHGGRRLRFLASSDLDMDGAIDLVGLTVRTRNSLYVLRGRVNGGFDAAVGYATASRPEGLAVGDVDGDGLGDVVVSNGESASISIFSGRGNAELGIPVEVGVGAGPGAIAIGNFNADLLPDIAVVIGTSQLAVLLQRQDHKFQAPRLFTTGAQPSAILALDLNDDGHTDLVTSNTGSGTVVVHFGEGDGSFEAGPHTTYPAGARARWLDAGDLNGDGRLDLAVANETEAGVSVLLGRGDGTFGGRESFGVPGKPWALVIDDFNKDQKPDIVVAGGEAAAIAVLINRSPDVPTPALVSLAERETAPDFVRITWYVAGSIRGSLWVERHDASGVWADLARVDPDPAGRVVFEDRAVHPGRRYGYRLAHVGDEERISFQPVWVEVPPRAQLAIERLRAVPSGLSVELVLAQPGPAALALLDVSGRRLARQYLEAAEPGAREVHFRVPVLPAGIYFVTLSQGAASVTRKTAVVR